MNLVVSPSKDQATEVLGPCGERLYVATEANKDDLTGLIKTLPVGKGIPVADCRLIYSSIERRFM